MADHPLLQISLYKLHLIIQILIQIIQICAYIRILIKLEKCKQIASYLIDFIVLFLKSSSLVGINSLILV